MKGFLVALQFLTRLPGPRLTVNAHEFGGSMRWFPAVGLVVGGIVAGGAWTGAHIDGWVGALVALLLWVGVTGALHLDGLGDVFDAAGAGHKDPARIEAVLSDPHIGSFGVVAIGVQLLAKLVLLHGVIEAGAFLALALTPAVARIGPLVWARTLSNLHDGLGSRFRDAVGIGTFGLWMAALLAGALLAPAMLACFVLVPLWALWLKRHLGGISGDGHGAGIEVVESGLLLAILLWNRLA
ncbi:adenosylcobinamide-GDP ribazoletransferase [soil metagenome]